MSKWRPALSGCLYVVPDIHGSAAIMQKVCARILPLRKTSGIKDKVVFLGDYIDRHQDSHKVLDIMVSLKKKYGDEIVCLIGNHELLLLEVLDLAKESLSKYKSYFAQDSYHMWLTNGGIQTLCGYLDRAGIKTDPFQFPRNRIIDLIPDEHLQFLVNDLVPYYLFNDYIFVHAAYNPLIPIDEVPIDELAWDRSILDFAKTRLRNGMSLPWDKTIITGHNNFNNKPFICNGYMMLNCGAPKQMLLVELNSMESFMVFANKNRMVRYHLQETELAKPSFKRVT